MTKPFLLTLLIVCIGFVTEVNIIVMELYILHQFTHKSHIIIKEFRSTRYYGSHTAKHRTLRSKLNAHSR